MSDQRVVRPGTMADIAAAVPMLSRAFADKAPMTWIQPDAAVRARMLPVLLDATLRVMLPFERGGDVLVEGNRIVGIAGWSPPGKWNPSFFRLMQLGYRMFRAVGPRNIGEFGRRGQAVDTALKKAHPKEPHWYLAIIGTAPEQHGTGAGRALMDVGIARCERDRMPAYLECDPSLAPFYERFGFAVTQTIPMPDGCPPQVAMWRPAS